MPNFRLARHRRKLLVATFVTALAAAAGMAAASTVGSKPSASPSFDGPVHAVAYAGDVVYVGGAFSKVQISGRNIPRQRLAAFNARTGVLLAWNPVANGTVTALAAAGKTVYAGGTFTTIGGQARPALAGITSAGALTGFRPRLAGSPLTLAAGNGLLYVGGQFTSADGFFRTNAAAFSIATGRLAGWAPRTDGVVNALAVYGTRVYLGGRFLTVGGLAKARHLAAVTAGTGAVDTHFLPHPPQPAYGVTADASGIYAAQGGGGGRLVSYSIWGVPRWARLFDGDAQAVTTMGGAVYVGGHFDKACGVATAAGVRSCPGSMVTRGKLAAFTLAGGLTTWAPTANGVIGVRFLAADTRLGQVTAGGDFTTVNGVVQKRYATFALTGSAPATTPVVAAYNFDTLDGAGSYADTTGKQHRLQVFGKGGATLETVARGSGRAIKFPDRCAGTTCPHLVLQAASTADLNPGRNPIRFGARVKLAANQTDDGENILQKGYSTAGGQYKLQVDKAAGRPSCGMTSAGTSTIYLVRSSVGMADGKWHTIECRRSGTSLTIQVDGTLTGTVAVPASLTVSNNAPLVLGGKGLAANNDQFHGYLDDVSISR